MKLLRLICFVTVLIARSHSAIAQGFINLGFENTTITPVVFPGGTRYTATVPGWTWSPGGNPVNGDPNSVALNDIALDAPAVTLHGLNDPSGFPPIHGQYSILLQGGSRFVPSNSMASIFQTAQIPLTSQSLIYSGGSSLQVLFNGQMLTPVALSNFANYTVWGVSISAFAGQSGELRFTKPWLNTSWSDGALVDDIQFSPTAVPEPGALALCGFFSLCLLAIRMMKPVNNARACVKTGSPRGREGAEALT